MSDNFFLQHDKVVTRYILKHETENKNLFLYQALEEIDGFDGVLLPQQFYDFIVRRDGSCRYTVNELQAWLNESDELPYTRADAEADAANAAYWDEVARKG